MKEDFLMATLKECIEKMTLTVGSRGAMPGERNIDYSVDSFVAPCDGYAVASGTQIGSGGWIALANGYYQVTNWSSVHPSNMFLQTPCRKGQKIEFTRGETVTRLGFSFFRSVGGGLKQLIFRIFFGGRYGFA